MDELESSPAIRALGPLFKLTQVYLRDDGFTQKQDSLSTTEATISHRVNEEVGAKIVSDVLEFGPSMEDMELIEQMNALGLPLSFQTNKERKNGMAKVTKKNTHIKNFSIDKKIDKEALEPFKVSGRDVVSPTAFHNNPSGSYWYMSKLSQSESSCSDVLADSGNFCCFSTKGEGSISLTAVKNGIIEELTRIVHLPIHDQSGDSMLSDDIFQDDMAVNTRMKCTTPDVSTTSHSSEACIDHDKEENVQKYSLETSSPTNHVGDCLTFSSNSDAMVQEDENGNHKWDANWRVYWDSLYQRNYYYNVITNVSTWFPPFGLEQEQSIERTDESIGIPTESNDIDKNLCSNTPDSCGVQRTNFQFEEAADDCRSYQSVDKPSIDFGQATDSSQSCRTSYTKNSYAGNLDKLDEISNIGKEERIFFSSEIHESLGSVPNPLVEISCENNGLHSQGEAHVGELRTQYGYVSKRKKKARNARLQGKSSDIDRELSFRIDDEYSANIDKYWCQRYALFSKFDLGVKMDKEGWFSVTPESIAKHHALRCGSGIVIDGFTGVGGNAIQFAKWGMHVIAVDIDPKKIEYAHHNAVIYEVDDRIDFVKGDFFCLAQNLKADAVFLSPPWGGPDYNKVKVYDIKTMLKPHNGESLFKVAKEIAFMVVMFLPKNVDLNQLAELALSVHPPWMLEVEKNFLNGKLKAITAYFSNTEVSRR